MRLETTNRAFFFWRNHPSLGIAGCFAAGIACTNGTRLEVDVGIWIGLAWVGCTGVVCLLRCERRRPLSLASLGRMICLMAALFFSGAAWHTHRAQFLPQQHAAHTLVRYLNQSVELRGCVSDYTLSSFRPQFILKSAAYFFEDRLSTVQGNVVVRVDGATPLPAAGTCLSIKGIPFRFSPARNPGGFDEHAYYRRLGVYAGLQATHFEVTASTLSPMMQLQGSIRAALEHHVSSDTARGLMLALILGDRSQLSPLLRERFAQTGLLHLLAVSGLHVFLVALSLYTLLRPLLLRFGCGWYTMETTRTLSTLVLLLLYAGLTGYSVSVVRAAVMASVFIIGRWQQQTGSGLNSLGVAALVLLAIRPQALFDAGFQLSFSATAAILLWNTKKPSPFEKSGMMKGLHRSFRASVAATAGTAPVLLVHFGTVPLLGLILNLIAIPLTAVTLLATILLLTTSPWANGLAHLFAQAAEGAITALVYVSTASSTMGESLSVSGHFSGLAALGLGVLIGAWAARYQRRTARKLLLLAGCLACMSLGSQITSAPKLDVLFLDVGQGDAALLRTPTGQTLLIDAGSRSPYHDVGASVIAPVLKTIGIPHIDLAVVTHPHMDHAGGMMHLLSEGIIQQLVIQDIATPPSSYRQLLQQAKPGQLRHVQAGDTLLVDPSLRIDVLAPTQALTTVPNLNEGSIVLLVQYGQTRFLFLGDAEARSEAHLVSRYAGLLEADVIKVGHHGSRTSSSPAFVDATESPSADSSWAIISVGQTNRYGLPDEEPLERWRSQGAQTLLTGTEGAIWLQSDGHQVRRKDWRKR